MTASFVPVKQFLEQRETGRPRDVVKSFNFNFTSDKICQKDVRGHTGCVNALQFSHDEMLLASGGDDGFCRVWAIDELMMKKAPRPIMKAPVKHQSNIFSLDFDLEKKSLYSGELNGHVFKHNIETNQFIFASAMYANRGDVYDLHQNPLDNNMVLVTRSQQVSFLDDRDRANPIVLNIPRGHFYTARFHPKASRILLITSRTDGPQVYDARHMGRPVINNRNEFENFPEAESWMGGSWSPSGYQFTAIQSHGMPIHFDLLNGQCTVLHSETYRNKTTVKSVTFIDDYTVATGSDLSKIHIWKVSQEPNSDENRNPSAREIAILEGHRSIPNQVCFSQHNQLLVSSGVEKIVKLWSDRTLPWSYDIPFVRRLNHDYHTSQEEEYLREKQEREVLEAEWDRDGLMDGRATWQDVFGGNRSTREHRRTLENFDTQQNAHAFEAMFDAARREFDAYNRQEREIDMNRAINRAIAAPLPSDSDDEEPAGEGLELLFIGRDDSESENSDDSSDSDDSDDSDEFQEELEEEAMDASPESSSDSENNDEEVESEENNNEEEDNVADD